MPDLLETGQYIVDGTDFDVEIAIRGHESLKISGERPEGPYRVGTALLLEPEQARELCRKLIAGGHGPKVKGDTADVQ